MALCTQGRSMRHGRANHVCLALRTHTHSVVCIVWRNYHNNANAGTTTTTTAAETTTPGWHVSATRRAIPPRV